MREFTHNVRAGQTRACQVVFAGDLAKGTRRDGPPTFYLVSLPDNVLLGADPHHPAEAASGESR